MTIYLKQSYLKCPVIFFPQNVRSPFFEYSFVSYESVNNVMLTILFRNIWLLLILNYRVNHMRPSERQIRQYTHCSIFSWASVSDAAQVTLMQFVYFKLVLNLQNLEPKISVSKFERALQLFHAWTDSANAAAANVSRAIP